MDPDVVLVSSVPVHRRFAYFVLQMVIRVYQTAKNLVCNILQKLDIEDSKLISDWFNESGGSSIEQLCETLTAGDIIQIERQVGYSHCAVYKGVQDGKHMVIHYTSPPDFNKFSFKYDAKVIEDELGKVIGKNKARINNFLDRHCQPLPVPEIHDKVIHYLADPRAFGQYSVSENNCEHFATKCRYGQKMSLQSMTAPMGIFELIAYHTTLNSKYFVRYCIVGLLTIVLYVICQLRILNHVDDPLSDPWPGKNIKGIFTFFIFCWVLWVTNNNRFKHFDAGDSSKHSVVMLVILHNVNVMLIGLIVVTCIPDANLTLFRRQTLLSQINFSIFRDSIFYGVHMIYIRYHVIILKSYLRCLHWMSRMWCSGGSSDVNRHGCVEMLDKLPEIEEKTEKLD